MRLTIDFTTSPSGFPLTAGTLDFMQRSYTEAVQAVAALAGSTDVIVSGCVVAGTQVSPGWIFTGGQLRFFVGGAAGANWRIKSEVSALSAENENGQEVDRFLTTQLRFDPTGSLDFRNLRRAGTLLEIQAQAARVVSFEPAVIVSGCTVSSVTSTTLSISPGTYVLNGQFYHANTYNGEYPVYFSAAGYSLADPGGFRVAFDPFTSQRSADVIGRASTKPGTLIEVAANVLDRFDPLTGLGRWEWLGYAVANGANGTADLRGRFRVGYDPGRQGYDVVGETGGAEQVTLTEAQMPRHAHGSPNASTLAAGDYGLVRKSLPGTNTTVAGTDPSQAGQEPDLTAAPIPIPQSGGSQPHENRPPYYVTLIIQRI